MRIFVPTLNATEQIKLLAFVTLVKSVYRNSVIYSRYSNAHHAKRLGIHANTFKKYIASLEDYGLLAPYGKDRQILGLSTCIKIILPEQDFYEMNHARFFQEAVQNKLNLKEIYNIILFSLVRRNFAQQTKMFEKKHQLLSDSGYLRNSLNRQGTTEGKHKAVKAIVRMAKKANVSSVDDYVKEMRKDLKKEVVTGKFHVANIIGMSPTTGAKYLRKWNASNLIERKKIVVKIKELPTNGYAFEMLTRTVGTRGKVVLSSKGYFLHFKGSVISKFQKPLEQPINVKPALKKLTVVTTGSSIVVDTTK